MATKPKDIVCNWLRVSGFPGAVPEYRFHLTRKWRFDYAFPGVKIAIEIEGITHEGGRHQRVAGFTKDCEKYLAAQELGWIIIRVTPKQFDTLAWRGAYNRWACRTDDEMLLDIAKQQIEDEQQ